MALIKMSNFQVLEDPIIRDIPGYEDLYQISEFGEVYNKKNGRELMGWIDSKGYRTVDLTNESGRLKLRVHRILAELFIPNPKNKSHIDHINNNKSDNRLCNLRWATPSENNTNRLKLKNNTSGYTGVSVINDGGYNYWLAIIEKNKSKITKCFPFTDQGLLDAATWYNDMKNKLHTFD